MIIKNGMVYTADFKFEQLDVEIENGLIKNIGENLPAQSGQKLIDAKGQHVLPGFVDIHSHGCVNRDFCDAKPEAIEEMLAYYGKNGVLSVVPATMSFNEPILEKVLSTAKPYFDKDGHGAVLRGVNMEGPFINVNKKGAQNAEYIVDPQIEMFNRLYEDAGGYIRIVDIAPELEGSIEFIKAVRDKVAISIAHTNANYSEATAAFEAGASHVTHMFNAMPPFGHREPGVIGAASDKAAHVEIISDGLHLHPAVVRSVFKWFGDDRICLISDSMRATGMPNGKYDLGGQDVFMTDGKAVLADGTIAGSATNLAECCRRAIGFGVPTEQAIKAATANPAKAAGVFETVGSLEKGKRADIQLWDKQLNTTLVISGGKAL